MVVAAVTVNEEDDGVIVVTWAASADGDTGKPVRVPGRVTNAAVGVIAGTIGTSSLQGSMDGVDFGALGAGLSIAASNRMDAVPVLPLYLRPTFGTSASGAVVVLTMRKT